MSDHIEVSDSDRIRTVRFNRANKKNAITQAMYKTLFEALESAGDSDVAAVVILGQPGIFSAGNDIGDFMMASMSNDLVNSPTMRFLRALATCEKPMVAGVDGIAIGVGTTLLMHCDLVFATSRSTLQTPFLNLGLVPEAGSSLIAPRLMGNQRAFELLALGEQMSVDSAREAGLINHIVGETDLEDRVFAAARKLAALPPEALSISRRLLRGDPAEVIERINEEAILFAERLKSAEAQEAFNAFMEKRPPSFTKAS